MEINKHYAKMKDVQERLLDFFDDSNDNEDNFINLVEAFNSFNINEDKLELIEILNLIVKITDNYHRYPTFFDRVNRVLMFFKKAIKQTLSNSSIFNIFKSNKKILLFLIENDILTIDHSIIKTMETREYNNYNYISYFYPETIVFIQYDKVFNKNILNEYSEDRDLFMKKRQIGENGHLVCELIRNDNVDEFIAYVNCNNLSLSSTVINPSSFETNLFLLTKSRISLICYAAFYGSIKIVKYLFMNGVEIDSNLWFYVIHGKNPDMIHFLEENEIKPKDETYQEVYDESIKCHHNDIANYIVDNLKPESDDFNLYSSIENYNFLNFQSNYLYDDQFFFNLCKYNYTKFVEVFLNTKEISIQKKFKDNGEILK